MHTSAYGLDLIIFIGKYLKLSPINVLIGTIYKDSLFKKLMVWKYVQDHCKDLRLDHVENSKTDSNSDILRSQYTLISSLNS